MDSSMDLKSMTLEELTDCVMELGEKKFRAKQIYGWLHQKLVRSPEEMKNVPAKCIEKLLKEHPFYGVEEVEHYESKIDGTQKFLFSLHDGNMVESVLMKYKHGNSVCISSQAGCRMGCRFCASTLLGLSRNLYPSEMLDQIYAIQKATGERVSHLVVMGTGEPFDNYDNVMNFLATVNHDRGLGIGSRHITISTCGIVPRIYDFANEHTQYNLAISLHAPNDELRDKLMPVNHAYPLKELMEAVKYYGQENNRRLTFEYILLNGVNDRPEHAKQLSKLLHGMNAYVNLIPYNAVDEKGFKSVSHDEAMVFYDLLMKNHVRCTIRKEHGNDIDAACGQLRIKEIKKEGI